jgi:hypothetical protein
VYIQTAQSPAAQLTVIRFSDFYEKKKKKKKGFAEKFAGKAMLAYQMEGV